MTSQKGSASKTPNPFSSVNDGLSGQKSYTQNEKSGAGGPSPIPKEVHGHKLHVRLEKDELQEFLVLLHDLGFGPDTVARSKNYLENNRFVGVFFTVKEK